MFHKERTAWQIGFLLPDRKMDEKKLFLFSDLSAAENEVLRGGQMLNAHRPSCMQLLGADANFRA